jgi:hypothetical protein
MILDLSLSGETSEIKRKGLKSSQKNYFGVQEESAVINFLNTDSLEERNKIYNEFLKKPIDKMISSIIRRYKLYRKDMDFTEIHIDTHSFLITKIDKFKPSKEKKAYSYFGTICKNYLMGQIIKDYKESIKKVSYEDISSDLENREEFSYEIDNEIFDTQKLINKFCDELTLFISNEDLNDNEKKLGIAIHEIFKNYHNIFVGTNNNKFNKNLILLSLREMTNLSTKEIRSSIKKYKELYFIVLNNAVK